MHYDRRTVLRGAAIGFLGASAGCLDGVGDTNEDMGDPTAAETGAGTEATPEGTATTAAESGTTATTTESGTTTADSATTGTETASDGTSTATPTCEDGLRPLQIDLPENYELAYRQGFDFELTADPGTLAVGEDLTIELRNTADEPRTTGPKSKYAIERRVEDGWQHVLQIPAGYTAPDGRVTHQPDEGFTWQFEASQQGFSVDPYSVCAPLQSGEYHFTYWGFPDAMRGLTIGFEVE